MRGLDHDNIVAFYACYTFAALPQSEPFLFRFEHAAKASGSTGWRTRCGL